MIGRGLGGLLAAVMLAASGAVFAEDEDAIYVDLRVSGAPAPSKGCTGGDWRLSWKGALPSEGSSISDMLLSYSAFDTTNEEDRDDPKAEIVQTPYICRDEEGRVTMSAVLRDGPRKIRGVIMLKDDPVQNSPGFWFDVEDVGVCEFRGEGQAAGMNLPVPVLGLRTSQGTTLSPSFRLTRKDLQDGFGNKRYTVSGAPLQSASFCLPGEITAGELVLRYKRESSDATVTLAGCAKLPVGQSTTLGATVDPDGGVLRFKAEPSNAFGLESGARDVQVTASSPGKGRITAEYEYDGDTATADVEASSLELISVNGGNLLPKLGLLGVDGKPTNKVYTFPFQLEPSDAGLDILFKAEKESLASVNSHRDSIDIQPVKEGTTALVAETSCGQPIGTPEILEIVPCDDEVIKELKREEADAKRKEEEVLKRINDLTRDPEFERAAEHIREAIIDLALKGGQLIINTLTLGEAGAVAGGAGGNLNMIKLQIANHLIDTADIIRDTHNGKILEAQYSLLVAALQNDRASALKSVFEATEAALNFGQDVGTLTGFADQLQTLEVQHDKVRRQHYDVQRRLALCKEGPPPPKPPPKGTDTPPQTSEPPPSESPPTTETPPSSETPPEPQPPQQTPPTDGPPPDEPPPKEPPPKVVSGPLCLRKDPTIAAAALNLNELGPSLAEYRSALTAAEAALNAAALDPNAMARIASLPVDQRGAALDELEARFNAYRDHFFALGEVAQKQGDQFKLCQDNLPPGVDALDEPPQPSQPP